VFKPIESDFSVYVQMRNLKTIVKLSTMPTVFCVNAFNEYSASVSSILWRSRSNFTILYSKPKEDIKS